MNTNNLRELWVETNRERKKNRARTSSTLYISKSSQWSMILNTLIDECTLLLLLRLRLCCLYYFFFFSFHMFRSIQFNWSESIICIPSFSFICMLVRSVWKNFCFVYFTSILCRGFQQSQCNCIEKRTLIPCISLEIRIKNNNNRENESKVMNYVFMQFAFFFSYVYHMAPYSRNHACSSLISMRQCVQRGQNTQHWADFHEYSVVNLLTVTEIWCVFLACVLFSLSRAQRWFVYSFLYKYK